MRTSRYGVLLVLALLLEAGFAAVFWIADLKQQVVEFIAVYLVVSLFYLVSCFIITRAQSAGSASRPLLMLVWGAGLVFRLTVFPLDPGLSEDLYRYRWQGKLQAEGGNPYTETPEDARWQELRDRTWPHVNRKNLPSVYGPVLELFYAAYYPLVALLGMDEFQQAWLYKVPFALLELAVALALTRLLALVGRPREWLLIYFWSPLMVIEFWAQGHNDTLPVLFGLLALIAGLKNRWNASIAWLTLAALSKFWPAILFPFLIMRREGGAWRFRWKAALLSIPITLLVSWPYLQGITNVTKLLQGFLGGWRNNDSLFGWLYAAADGNFSHATTLVTFALILALAILWSLQLPLVKGAKWAVVILLFLSANCFPWYLSWLLPFLALYPTAALLLWTALVSLAYQVLIGYQILGTWQDSTPIRMLEYLPVYGLLLGSGVARLLHRAQTPSASRYA